MGRLIGAPADLATWTSRFVLVGGSRRRGRRGHLFDLFFQLRCNVRLDNERNFGLTLKVFEVNDGKRIVYQFVAT